MSISSVVSSVSHPEYNDPPTPHATFPRLPQHLRFFLSVPTPYSLHLLPHFNAPMRIALRPLAYVALVILALLVFGAALSATLEPFASASTADRCKYIQPTTRYALDKAGADRPCLWHSANEGYGPMDREACQEKCASTEHPERCVGFTQPTDGVCVLYGAGALPDVPPTGMARGGEGATTFYACRDTAPPTYLEQRDGQLDIRCTRAAEPKPRDTCPYLGSPGCAEGRCLPPFKPDATMSCTQAWSALLDEFPAEVDPAQGGLIDREAFLRASCDGSVGVGREPGGRAGAGADGTCAQRK